MHERYAHLVGDQTCPASRVVGHHLVTIGCGGEAWRRIKIPSDGAVTDQMHERIAVWADLGGMTRKIEGKVEHGIRCEALRTPMLEVMSQRRRGVIETVGRAIPARIKERDGPTASALSDANVMLQRISVRSEAVACGIPARVKKEVRAAVLTPSVSAEVLHWVDAGSQNVGRVEEIVAGVEQARSGDQPSLRGSASGPN